MTLTLASDGDDEDGDWKYLRTRFSARVTKFDENFKAALALHHSSLPYSSQRMTSAEERKIAVQLLIN